MMLFSYVEHTNGDGDYTSSLLGILVMQDVHLGLLVALLHALAGHGKSANAKTSIGAVHNIISGHDHGNSGKIIRPVFPLKNSFKGEINVLSLSVQFLDC